MAHTFTIDTESGVLREAFADVVDLAVMTEANTKIIADSRFQKGLSFLTDLRDAKMTMNYQEMFKHVSQLPDLGTKKQAFIVDSDFQFGILRMFGLLSEDKGIHETMQIFREVEEGFKWLSS
jgi:hypothetical protein